MIIGIAEFFASGGIALMGRMPPGLDAEDMRMEYVERIVDDPQSFFYEIMRGLGGIYSLNCQLYYPLMVINYIDHKLVFATWDEIEKRVPGV